MSDAPEQEPERQYFFMDKMKDWVSQEKTRRGRELTCRIETFGCQMNARDSEKLLGILLEMGFVSTDKDDADLVLLNTCTVRDNADQKTYGHLGRLVGFKRKNPDMLIALCGCMMQEPQVIEKIKKSYPFVDIVFGTFNIHKLAELLARRIQTSAMVIDVWPSEKEIVEELPASRKYPFKSGVNIMYGCDNFCSYCIVPYVRGRERSRPENEIIDEVRRLADDGVREIMLLGQNVNSYGKKLSGAETFASLLRKVCEVEGIERVRFMTSHPKDLSDDLIAAMSENPKVCRHLHLPVQSGSSRLLKIMNRHYTKEDYLSLVDRIRKAMPDIALTTDIMVAFPGETEEDFEETLDVVRKVGFDNAFTFLYSRRSGTPAADMPDQIPADVAKERFDRLLAEVQSTARQRSERFVGTVQDVLVESENRQLSGYMTGRTGGNYLVHFPGCEGLIGKIIPVRLNESKGFYYMGIPEENMEVF